MLKEDCLKYIPFKTFTDELILLISDTHIASSEENIYYLKQLKTFIQENNIKTLIHAGDVADGMVNYHKKYSSYQDQIKHLKEVYPVISGVTQYILGGNHDGKYQKKAIDLLQVLESIDKSLIGVGYYQSYFKIGDKIISLEHNSKKNINNLVNPSYRILGHGHHFASTKDKLYLPTLSDSMPNKIVENNNPGFVLLKSKCENNQVILNFDNYIVDNENYYKVNKKTYII